MTRTRPFTLVAAVIFLCMALLHLYRLAIGFNVTIGETALPMSVSWIGLAIGALLSAMLFRESRG